LQSFPVSEPFKERRLGFLINPIAGMGGKVGLKGTDGLSERAREMGAEPVAPKRAIEALRHPGLRGSALFLTASGDMGEDALREAGLAHRVVHRANDPSGPEDTIAACQAFVLEGAELILFCGGDGTARNVAFASGETPILGIPAGVKMHSGVFAVSPKTAAGLAFRYLNGELQTRETEVADVDEESYRSGVLQTRIYATARTPYLPALVQERKQVYSSPNEDEFKREIALFANEFMRDGSAYIMGAGTTTESIAREMGVTKTLLGVDVVREGETILMDASESDLLRLIGEIREEGARAMIIVSPIGAQGFVLGRGSQQISADVIRLAGPENLIIVGTPHKLAELSHLLVDTGDFDLDCALSGERQVVCGYRLAQRKKVIAAGDLL